MSKLLFGVLLAACSSSPHATHDVDAGADAGPLGFEPAEAAVPERPRMTPCPPGWREVADVDDPELRTCDPWPEGGRADCGIDEAHFPGGTGCERIGTPCPAGDFAEDLPAGANVVYVLAGAAAGGDGSLATPFASVEDAITAAPDDSVVAISKGVFDEVISIPKPVTLWGACVADTELTSSVSSDDVAVVTFRFRGGAVVRNLRISGARGGVRAYGTNDPVTLDAVVVAESSVVGLGISNGGDVVASDFVIRDTLPDARGYFGDGIAISAIGRAELHRAVIERNRTLGILVAEPQGELVATDLVVADTLSQESDRTAGLALAVFGGATVTLERAALEGSGTVGMDVADPGTHVVATDLVVRDTRGQDWDGIFGFGLRVGWASAVELERATFERNVGSGILTLTEGSTLGATDLVIRDTAEDVDQLAVGLTVFEGSGATVTRGAIERGTVGIVVADASSELLATDLSVGDVHPRADGRVGYGFEAYAGAHAELLRASFVRNATTGVYVVEAGTTLVASDLAVEDTSTDPGGTFGDGLQVADGASAEVHRARLARNHRIGLFASNATVTVEDLVAQGTLPQSCAAPCPGFGMGIAADGRATVSATRFRVSENELCGLQLSNGGEIDLHTGEVSHNVLGANVQTVDFDVTRLQDDVLYFGNEGDLDASSLPVPEAIQSF